MPIQNPIRVIDADLMPAGGAIDTIHVWYEGVSSGMEQLDMCGHDFFLRWLPKPIARKFGSIITYWHSIHPYERNAHIAEYMLDRAPLLAN